jgi:hypothetical protein
MASSTAQSAAPTKSGHTGRNVAVVIVVLLFIFFFLPVVPYNYSTSSAFGASSSHVSGYVSPSAYLFACGLVVNLQGTGYVFGAQVSQNAPVSGFFCNVSAQH